MVNLFTIDAAKSHVLHLYTKNAAHFSREIISILSGRDLRINRVIMRPLYGYISTQERHQHQSWFIGGYLSFSHRIIITACLTTVPSNAPYS